MSTQAQPIVVLDADGGKRRIEWAFSSMPVLLAVRKQFIKDQPFDGLRVLACMHLTAQAAPLFVVLRDGGATVTLAGADAAATQEDVVASLERDYSIPTLGPAVDDASTRQRCIEAQPHIVIDSRAVLASHSGSADLIGAVAASVRAKCSAARQTLPFPVIAASDSAAIEVFAETTGAGQSTIDTILRSTNILLAGTTVLVVGFGPAARGIAARARGLGANVIVAEVDPVRALEAAVEGFRAASLSDGIQSANVVVTALAVRNVIAREQIERLKDGAILCNAGASHAEIDVEALGRACTSRRDIRPGVEECKLKDGRRVWLLAGGHPLNGHAGATWPSAAEDLRCAALALSAEYLAKNRGTLEPRVYPPPPAIDKSVARMKLAAMGVTVDKLTIEQEEYLAAWSEGN
jgi:adenosylhomocysteinase